MSLKCSLMHVVLCKYDRKSIALHVFANKSIFLCLHCITHTFVFHNIPVPVQNLNHCLNQFFNQQVLQRTCNWFEWSFFFFFL